MTSSKTCYEDYDQFAPNFDMAYIRLHNMSLPNLKFSGPLKAELQAKEFWGFHIYYLLTGCKGRTRKYKLKVFHTARACEGCLENQGLVFPGTARAPS